jgi:hypothetical protein
MNRSAQIFSLDLLISLAVVTLAIGLVLQFAELGIYGGAQESEYAKLVRITRQASDLLVANSTINCMVDNSVSADYIYLVNCIDASPAGIANINNQNLGIPQGYDFSVYGAGGTISKSSGTLGTQDYYEVSRKIVYNVGPITKQKFESGDFTSKTFYPNGADVTVKVWKQ